MTTDANELVSHLEVTETRDRQFDDGSWHPFHEMGVKVMRKKHASFRLANNGGGTLALELVSGIEGMDCVRSGSVLINNQSVGEFSIEETGRVRRVFYFRPFDTEVLDVEIRVDRMIRPADFGYPEEDGIGLALFEARVVCMQVPCMEPWVTIYVTWDGKIRTCCASEQEFGDLTEAGIEEIWNGRDFTAFREDFTVGIMSSACENCVNNHRQKFEIFSMGEALDRKPERCRPEDFRL